jgi:hypothetical protein
LIDNNSYFRYVLSHMIIGLIQLLNVVFHHLYLFNFDNSCSPTLLTDPLWVSWGYRSRSSVGSTTLWVIHVNPKASQILYGLSLSIWLHLLSTSGHRAWLDFVYWLILICTLGIIMFNLYHISVVSQLWMTLTLNFMRNGALRWYLCWLVQTHRIRRSQKSIWRVL